MGQATRYLNMVAPTPLRAAGPSFSRKGRRRLYDNPISSYDKQIARSPTAP